MPATSAGTTITPPSNRHATSPAQAGPAASALTSMGRKMNRATADHNAKFRLSLAHLGPYIDPMAHTPAWRNFKRAENMAVATASLIYAGAVLYAFDHLPFGRQQIALRT